MMHACILVLLTLFGPPEMNPRFELDKGCLASDSYLNTPVSPLVVVGKQEETLHWMKSVTVKQQT
jgi:hypothetical protein